MSQTVTGSGKTIDQAVSNALKILQLPEEKVTVEVIQEPESGLLGIFGRKEAVVKVTTLPTRVDKAVRFLNRLFKAMQIDCDVEAHEDDDFLRINLSGRKMGILIGRRGQTLDAIQYLTSLVVNDGKESYKRVIVDTENYRQKRQKTLEDLADKMAQKAKRYHKRIYLEPMNPAERRIIHARLQNNEDVMTHSIGKEPYRHVVIQAY